MITKFLRLVCILSTMAWTIQAAELNYIEYFIDTDPGQGNGYGLNLLSDTLGSYAYFTNLLLLNTPYGSHVLYTRYRDTQGRYSGPRGKKFVVAAQKNLVAAEEFIDNDPGKGLGQAKDVTDFADTYSFQNHTYNLPAGLGHIFYTRYRAEDGTWSIARGKRFNLAPSQTFTAAEYFVEPDPGHGNGTFVDIADASNDAFDYRNAVTPAPVGSKIFDLRYRTADGYWSPVNQSHINILPPSPSGLMYIGSAEFFIGSDPGPGNGTAMTAEDGAFDELEERAFAVVAIDSHDVGLKVVCFRVRDGSGTWTNPVCDTVGVPVRLVIRASVSLTPPGFVDIKLTWTPQGNASEYRVHSDSVSTGSFTPYTTVFAPDTFYTFSLDTSKAKQFYRVVPVAPNLGADAAQPSNYNHNKQ